MTTRREFLGGGILGLFTIMASPVLKSQINKILIEKNDGLFFSEKDIERIRANTKSPLFESYWKSLKEIDIKADIKTLKEEIDLHNHVYHLPKINDILNRSSFISLVDESKEHEDVAKRAIDKLYEFNEWDYFTEGTTKTIGLQRAPETTLAMCMAYECLKNKISQAERDAILDAIEMKGVPPCYNTLYGMKHNDEVKGWGFLESSTYKYRYDLSRWPNFLNGTNLKAIPISGLAYGAVILKNKSPNAKKWLELAEQSAIDFAKLYGKDGAYPEGVSYAGYATQHLLMTFDVLHRHNNLNYEKLLNFSGIARYLLLLQSPFHNQKHATINFSDTSFSCNPSFGFWVAKKFKDPIAQYMAENISSQRNLSALIWYDKSIKSQTPPKSLFDIKLSTGWVISRTGWTENDTVFALRSGGPANHEHSDRNSIIINAFGERLIHDPLGAAYSNTEKHWLLRQSAAHNNILIDGKGHQYLDGKEGTNSSKAVAEITQFSASSQITVVTSDATPAYKMVIDDVTKVQRSAAFIKPDIFIIVDEIEKDKPSSFQSRFQAYNVDNKAITEVAGDQKSFMIKRPDAILEARVFSDLEFTIKKDNLDIQPEKGVFPFIEVSTKESRKCTLINVFVAKPSKDFKACTVETVKTKTGFDIKIDSGTKKTTVNIVMNKKYPRFTYK